MTHEKFLKMAADAAEVSATAGRYPYGAIVVRDDVIIGDSNIIPDILDVFRHSEFRAIYDAASRNEGGNLTGAILYSSHEPCEFCMAAAKLCGINEIHFDKKVN